MRLRLKGCEDAVAESANAPADMLSKEKNANTTASAVTGVKHAVMGALDESGNPILVFFTKTSTGGTHCAEGRQITTLASCREAAKQLNYTWGGTNAQTHYPDGCSIDSAGVWFNTNVRVGGGPVFDSVSVGTGLCTGNLVRVYNGEADNPGTTILERREACASACANKKTAVSTSPTQWDVHPGVVLGFALHRGSDTGRCYCEMKVCEGLSAK